VVYGTDDEGVRIFEEALGSVAGLTGLGCQEVDPKLGANFLVFFVAEWQAPAHVPNLAKLISNIEKLSQSLAAAGANQYRIFGFDEAGAIRICITLIRYDEEMQSVSAPVLAVGRSVMGLLLWSDQAFTTTSPIAVTETGRTLVKPWYADLIRAAYDPILPAASAEPALALRLAARMTVLEESR